MLFIFIHLIFPTVYFVFVFRVDVRVSCFVFRVSCSCRDILVWRNSCSCRVRVTCFVFVLVLKTKFEHDAHLYYRYTTLP